jgi:GMP synthase-like glutamine amidotransferase
MRVHVFQHVPFEGLGSIGAWLDERRATVGCTRFFAGDKVPPLNRVDLLITMGGPMSVNDEQDLPWLKEEKQAIRDAIASDVSVLGVCLGAQLIASALGSRVYANPVREIGWFPVRAVEPPARGAFRFPAEALVFHWHGETFDVPPGAVRLAGSEACENQAFQLKHNVLGLQFHLETTPDAAGALLDHCRGDLAAGPYVQSEEALRAAPRSRYADINRLMAGVLAFLVEAARTRPAPAAPPSQLSANTNR